MAYSCQSFAFSGEYAETSKMNKYRLVKFLSGSLTKGLKRLYPCVLLTLLLTLSNIGISYSQFAADFELNPAEGCAVPHTVFFTDQSVLPDTWFWNFGDGSRSTLQNPVHAYTSAGEFPVSLTISDTNFGFVDTHTEVVKVFLASADFTGSPLFGCGPLTTTFTDASALSGPDSITSWEWDFGDGNTSTDENPTHIYDDPGIYAVSLTITGSTGCSNTKTRTNYVQVIGPDVDFTASGSASCGSGTYTFTDATIFGAPITSWDWDFGDGGTSNLQNPSHSYTTEGLFDVSLTVTDIDGCSRTLIKDDLIDTRDLTPPSITCPVNQSVTANVLGEFTIPDYTGLATTSDDCDGSPVVSQSPTAGTIVNGGTTVITLTSTDASDNSANCTFDLVVTDNVAPTVTISTTSDDPTNLPFTVTILFSEAVQGFDVTDISVSNANKSDFSTVNALEYSVLITPVADGSVTVSVPANSATDLASNNNTASNQISLTYDVTAPTLEIMGAANAVNSTASFSITVQFDEAVEGFVEGELVLVNGAKSNFQSVDSDTYTLDITPDGNGDLTLNAGAGVATDLAGNPNTAASEVTIIYDDIAPSVTLTTTATNPTNASFEVTILFSEDITGFTVDDLDITNGTKGSLTTVNAAEYRVTITPLADGDVTVGLAANAAIDIADNGNTTASPLTIRYDATAPTVAFVNVPTTLNATAPISLSLEFSEAIEKFVLADINLTNATGSSLSSTDQINWTFQLTPTGAGDITMVITIGAAQDPAGNTTSNTTQASILFDATPPSVSITSAADIATNSPFDLTIDFSEDVSGFELVDLDPTNATLGNFSMVNASRYTVTVTPTSEGLMTVDIPANVAQDVAANHNTAATPFTITYDTTDPQVQLSGAPANVNATDAFSVSIVFSEEITSFTQGDFSITNGSLANFQSSDQITFTVEIIPSGLGDITLSIPVSAAEDLASNPNIASEEVVIIFDDEAPTFTSLSTISLPENGADVVSVTAEDRLDVTFSLDGGEDASLFSFDGTTNVLSFAVAPDFESPQDEGADNTHIVVIKATDEAGNESTQEINVTITNLDENAPRFTSADELMIEEGESVVTTVTASDESSFQLSIAAGSDGELFALAANGALTFVEAPDFEMPLDTNGDNIYSLTINALDIAGNSTNQTLQVTVTDVDEIEPLYEGATSFSLNEGTVNLATIGFVDASELSYVIEDAVDGSFFNIGPTTGELAFIEAPDFETPLDQSSSNTYQITVTATDQRGNSSSVDLTIAVADVDENPPVFDTDDMIRVDENQTAITVLVVNDESEYTLSIGGGADQDLISLNTATGELTFLNPANYEAPLDSDQDNEYLVSIAATDALNNMATLDLVIAVADKDENAPVLSTQSPISHEENQTAITVIDASDESALTYSISGGEDAGLMQIDPSTGALSFTVAPDFENPTDGGQDNTYLVGVTVTDTEGNTAGREFGIVVTDVLETLAVAITASTIVNEGDGQLTYLLTLPEPTPVPATLSYTLSGTATPGVDYSDPKGGTLVLERGVSTAALALDLTDDLLAEVPESIILTNLTSSYEGLMFPDVPVEVTITDNDLAIINLQIVRDGQEGINDAAFRLSTTIAFEADAIVEISTDGTALLGDDYESFPTSLTIPAGEFSIEIIVPLIDDNLFEKDETLVVNILAVPDATATVGESGSITLNILDNDEAPPLSVPTLFTPNNDGINDQFIIRGGGEVAEITFTIMSRDGSIVFQSSNWDLLSTNGWDGTSNGIDQTSDPYIWTVTAINIRGEVLSVNGASSGVIQLVR